MVNAFKSGYSRGVSTVSFISYASLVPPVFDL